MHRNHHQCNHQSIHVFISLQEKPRISNSANFVHKLFNPFYLKAFIFRTSFVVFSNDGFIFFPSIECVFKILKLYAGKHDWTARVYQLHRCHLQCQLLYIMHWQARETLFINLFYMRYAKKWLEIWTPAWDAELILFFFYIPCCTICLRNQFRVHRPLRHFGFSLITRLICVFL